MNTNDLNNTTMIGTTISYCELKAAMTAAIAAYATLVSTAKTKLTLINNLNIIALSFVSLIDFTYFHGLL